jgi:hypothetical protein
MVEILPESPSATFALVIFLAGATGYQLNSQWNGAVLALSFTSR